MVAGLYKQYESLCLLSSTIPLRMKLFLAIVTAIAVFTVDCRDFSNEPEGRDTDNKIHLFSEDIKDLDEPYGNNFAENQESDYDDHQMKEDENEQHQKKLRRSKCKARNACVVMGGFCVTNATLCSGRLVPEGCKGTYCQCCVPGILEAKIESLEAELRSFKENVNSSNSDTNTELQSLKENTNNMNSNLISKLNNINSSLASLAENHGCPEGFFELSASNQCFKYFTESTCSWTAAKSKCQSEGLVMAKPYDPLELRSYLVMRYGNTDAWMGARGTGSYVKWDRDGATLGSSNPFWYNGYPSGSTSTSYCLVITAYESNLKSYPSQPYWMQSCSSGRDYALCEWIME